MQHSSTSRSLVASRRWSAICAAAMMSFSGSVLAHALQTEASGGAESAAIGGPTKIEDPAQACAALAHTSIADTKIASAEILPANSTLKDPDGKPVVTSAAVCRVVATVSTKPDEHVGIEVWLPTDAWNGRLLGLGSGGFGGAILYSALAPATARGFVAVNTDTGHQGGAQGAIGQRLEWALNPAQLRDWGHSSVHLMTVAAKSITTRFYGHAASRAYYSGCSTGGAEAMEEVEYYPDDYDGVHAGSPGMDYSHLMESFLWSAKLPAQQPEAKLSPEALGVLSRAVLQSCEGADAVRDGFLERPTQCHFDPSTVQCKAGDDPSSCLSEAQVHEAERLYSPVLDSRTGKELYPGFVRGSENQWALIQGALVPNYAQPLVANVVFNDPNWDWTTFDFGKDGDRLDAKLAPSSDAMQTDLSRFKAHGGKLIMTQGWSDSFNAQTLPIEYFDDVAKRQGGVGNTQRFFRLVMIPGMSHCGGGTGPTSVGGNTPPVRFTPDRDVVTALEAWVEHGKAPGTFISTKYVDDKPGSGVQFERPVCTYPAELEYAGHGDRKAASSYRCVVPRQTMTNQ
ncbi:feruloyl esterase [Pararobbsia alpina]|uniref:tannase/feruloyl esterase family alpha/beta hydrolase n=1 Tax=Pararobbsia alpina TaxID=621374 RepID=UPI0039A480CB